MQGGLVKDTDRKTLAHALVGCFVVFVLWPLNVLIAGFMKNIRIHVGCSLALIICLGVAYGVGIATSNQYNRVGPPSHYTGTQANNCRSQNLSTHPTKS